jgi:hypothetical protein
MILSTLSYSVSEEEFRKEHNQFLKDNRFQASKILSDNFRFNRIELVFIDIGPIYYSWWGHIALRLISGNKKEESDLTIDFIADFNDYKTDNLKAYFGGYDPLVQVREYSKLYTDYSLKEGREMSSYPIIMNKLQRKTFLKVLRQWIINPKSAGTYTFRRNNCSGLLLKLLHSSGLNLSKDFSFYPFDIATELMSRGVIRPVDKNQAKHDNFFLRAYRWAFKLSEVLFK